MNSRRLDALSRLLARSDSRRSALRSLASAGIAAGLIWLGRAEDAAACRKNGKKCKKSKQCCSKKCKGKKCRCTPLKGTCPGAGADHV